MWGERLKGMTSRVGQASVQLGLACLEAVQGQQQQAAGSTGVNSVWDCGAWLGG